MAYHSAEGTFHLTANGWIEKDDEPFPSDRAEAWQYSMHQSSGFSKERISFRCVWADPAISRTDRDALRKRIGSPECVHPSSMSKISIGDPL